MRWSVFGSAVFATLVVAFFSSPGLAQFWNKGAGAIGVANNPQPTQ